MFVDFVKIYVKAGDGGDGAATFHKEKYVPYGGPDGGDGGNGGNIVFIFDRNLNTLQNFRFKKKFIAEDGENGKKNKCSGKNGEDLIIKVPRGTIIKDIKNSRVLADVVEDRRYLIAKGGRGGWGNLHFKNPTRQAPSFSKPGLLGEELEISLELKLLSDVGLIGFPNAGKSTFISAISNARPKIGNYEFTTLVPNLGVVEGKKISSFVVADIPGLIEGASKGKGLGYRFLKHIERCRILLHLVDVSCLDDMDPVEKVEIINRELRNFTDKLEKKKQIIVATKIDSFVEEKLEKIEKYAMSLKIPFFSVSSVSKKGIEELLSFVGKFLEDFKEKEVFYEPTEKLDVLENKSFRSNFSISKKGDVYYIEAKWLYKIVDNMDLYEMENLRYLHKVLKNSGIDSKLKEMGILKGDIVYISGYSFQYEE